MDKIMRSRREFGRLLGLAGATALVAPMALKPLSASAAAGDVVNPSTGHRMDGGFADYWHRNGGLAIFGYPISDLFDEVLEDGRTYKVQYTERTRFEYHMENQPPYHILLGAFGRQVLDIRRNGGGGGGNACGPAQPGPFSRPFNLPSHPDLNALFKGRIEDAPRGQWFHRVFNQSVFNAQNNWAGADSWFVTLAVLHEQGGRFRSFGNPGQIIFRQDQTYAEWQLAVLTTARYKAEFMAGASGQVGFNIRTAPRATVSLVHPNGNVVASRQTSDMGDLQVILPDECRVTIACAYRTEVYTGETHIWWGPRDRTDGINTLDGNQYQWG